ncbi:cytochrome c/c1 heme-lyase [Polychytrium aggregatum]|uniref:cytochrome c/c1 heme-lyase n=1 Tax=Polychytrium aggregatum TaxID=110093 RepID=UPI0022FDFA67|nr:cytochrome c/c1 heme-lyase [Polychytrium aggregatum]KAI9208096.1 cytochrome c/c1 heme-lyase [Polychytrium aggregatum]
MQQEQINPLNNMLPPNQAPAPGQKQQLSIDREKSSIPMGGKFEGQVWVYPSEQMFFNAMRRKSWDPEERDMSVIVPIHNAVNEQAWRKIMEWESVHKTECGQPRLLQFQGKPKEYSPKARIMNFFGYTLPFDRHDWVVDRCGKRITYVIDFYSGDTKATKPGQVSFYLDVRPAISWEGVKDRLYRFATTGSGLF